jgi:hypothetical protein
MLETKGANPTRMITYIVTTTCIQIKEPPEGSEYSKLAWVDHEHIDNVHGDKMEQQEKQAVVEAINFAAMNELEPGQCGASISHLLA